MDVNTKHSIYSMLRENIVEHLFIGEVLRTLWCRGIVDAEILKSEFDAGGYDLVLSCKTVTRHIQLKVGRAAGARFEVNVNLRLADKPSGCIIWILVDDNLEFKDFLWFGGDVAERLPSVESMKIARHTKGTADGIKNERLNHRVLKRSAFTSLKTLEALLFKLIGAELMSQVPEVYVTAAHSADYLYDGDGLPI